MRGDVILYKDFPKGEREISKRIADAQIIAVKWLPVSEQVIENAHKLEHIITLTSGYGHLPLVKAREKGINIINCPTHNSQAVAEHTIALMFALVRQVSAAHCELRAGKWKDTPNSYIGSEVAGKKIGIVGFGNIGQRVAKLAQGLGMKVVYVDSKSTPEEFDSLLASSDVVTLNLPYSGETHHLINWERLKQMKKLAYLINTARGTIVDQKALLSALVSGEIAGAALDVFEGEPTVGEAPSVIVKLAKLPNVVATPHIAYNTKEAAFRLGEELLRNVAACVKGKPINIVN